MQYPLIALCALVMGIQAAQAQHRLEKVWQTDTILSIPESVLYDVSRQTLYVSLINGNASVKDGQGGIARLTPAGGLTDTGWIKGLHAPKGMGLYQNRLYVADVDAVAVIDLTKGKLLKKIVVPGALFLNDVTIDTHGIVYVSDSRRGNVIRIEKDQPTIYLDSLQGPNGLLAMGTHLYVLASGSLLQYDAQGTMTTVATGMEKSTDGLVAVRPGAFLVSCWAGVVYYVHEGYTPEQLLDLRVNQINTADIWYNEQAQLLYIPTFYHRNVIAYRLQ